MKKCGFTLSEILVALAILGVIATFTIPKILESGHEAEKKAVFKEIIASMNAVIYLGGIQGELNTSTADPGNYIMNQLNGAEICNTDAGAQGCWDTVNQTANGNWTAAEITEPGMRWHSGANMTGLGAPAIHGREYFVIDWNGSAGPNTHGDDQIFLVYCYDENGTQFSVFCTREGTIIPHPAGTANEALWDSLWQ